MNRIEVFLGGTVGKSNWRESFVADLVQAGVAKESIFNPVVAEWNEAAMEAEDKAKKTAAFNLFYITNPDTDGQSVSVYSLVEAVMGLYDNLQSTVVVFDYCGYSGHILKALTKSEKDLRKRFPYARIFSTREEALSFLVDRITHQPLLDISDGYVMI
jgi:hypothetical protein